MALPTVAKTWQFNVNQTTVAPASILLSYQNILFKIKNSLTGFALSPWTVYYSCGGGVAGTPGDGVDRWSAPASIIHGLTDASAHSWIVLKQTGLNAAGNGFQMLFNWAASGSAVYSIGWIVISNQAGFTGGSATARPTATDEQIMMSGTAGHAWMQNIVVPFQSQVHVMSTTDGAAGVVIVYVANVGSCFWFFNKLSNPVTGFSVPVVTYPIKFTGSATSAIITSLSGTTQNWGFRQGGVNYAGSATCEGLGVAVSSCPEQLAIAANEIDGAWPIFPLGFMSVTAGVRGRHGRFTDLWVGSAFHPDGTTYPSDGSRQFVQFGHVVLPWNGSVPLIT